jgi:hypothetical protein
MYKYVITFEGVGPDLTLTPPSPVDPVDFVEKMNIKLFDPLKIEQIIITPFKVDTDLAPLFYGVGK